MKTSASRALTDTQMLSKKVSTPTVCSHKPMRQTELTTQLGPWYDRYNEPLTFEACLNLSGRGLCGVVQLTSMKLCPDFVLSPGLDFVWCALEQSRNRITPLNVESCAFCAFIARVTDLTLCVLQITMVNRLELGLTQRVLLDSLTSVVRT